MIRRILAALGVLAALAFAIQGGEYGTTDLLRQRARSRELHASIDTLAQRVDSLRRARKAIESDPAEQERIAREEFGMVRGDKELLYRFADSVADSASAGARPR